MNYFYLTNCTEGSSSTHIFFFSHFPYLEQIELREIVWTYSLYYTILTQLMIISNNVEYDADEIKADLHFNYFREEENFDIWRILQRVD